MFTVCFTILQPWKYSQVGTVSNTPPQNTEQDDDEDGNDGDNDDAVCCLKVNVQTHNNVG